MPQAQITFLRPPGLPGVEMVTGHNVRTSFVRHVHQALVLGRMESGGRRIVHACGSVLAPAGCVFLIPAGLAHRCPGLTAEGQSYRLLCLRPESAAPGLLLSGLDEASAPAVFFESGLSQALDRLFFAIERAAALPEVHAALTAALHRLAGQPDAIAPLPRRPAGPAMVRAREYVAARATEPLPLERLGRHVGLSVCHVQRRFVEAFGVSPQELALGLRIRQARTLLEAGLPVADVALETGFYDQSHFSRQFVRLMGIPPGRYARRAAACLSRLTPGDER